MMLEFFLNVCMVMKRESLCVLRNTRGEDASSSASCSGPAGVPSSSKAILRCSWVMRTDPIVSCSNSLKVPLFLSNFFRVLILDPLCAAAGGSVPLLLLAGASPFLGDPSGLPDGEREEDLEPDTVFPLLRT